MERCQHDDRCGNAAHEVVWRGCAENAEREGEGRGGGKPDAAAARISEHAPSVRAGHRAAEDDARYEALR